MSPRLPFILTAAAAACGLTFAATQDVTIDAVDANGTPVREAVCDVSNRNGAWRVVTPAVAQITPGGEWLTVKCAKGFDLAGAATSIDTIRLLPRRAASLPNVPREMGGAGAARIRVVMHDPTSTAQRSPAQTGQQVAQAAPLPSFISAASPAPQPAPEPLEQTATTKPVVDAPDASVTVAVATAPVVSVPTPVTIAKPAAPPPARIEEPVVPAAPKPDPVTPIAEPAAAIVIATVSPPASAQSEPAPPAQPAPAPPPAPAVVTLPEATATPTPIAPPVVPTPPMVIAQAAPAPTITPPAPVAPPAPPPSAPRPPPDFYDVQAVPHLTPEGRIAYTNFLGYPLPRAFAISKSGGWGFGVRGNDPRKLALDNCERRGGPCEIYALDKQVVWTGPQ